MAKFKYKIGQELYFNDNKKFIIKIIDIIGEYYKVYRIDNPNNKVEIWKGDLEKITEIVTIKQKLDTLLKNEFS